MSGLSVLPVITLQSSTPKLQSQPIKHRVDRMRRCDKKLLKLLMLVLLSCATRADDSPEPKVRAVDRMQLKVFDARGNGVSVGVSIAIGGSANYAIIKLHSNEQGVIDRVDEALRTMMLVGYVRVGMVIADGPNGYDNTAELYVVAADGEPSATFSNMDSEFTRSRIHEALSEKYPLIWKEKREMSPYKAPEEEK